MTEKRQRRPKRSTGEMKPWGRLLNRLMVDREMYEWKDLVAAMKAEGFSIEGSKLSGYLYGERHPRDPEEFFGMIAKVLDLDNGEKKELMFAYGFPDSYALPGGNSGIGSERAEKITAAEEELRRRARSRESETGGLGSDEGPRRDRA